MDKKKRIEQALKKIQAFRQQEGFRVLIIPTSDPHLSEYLSEHWKLRAYFSGFTGSAGTLLLQEQPYLWTDSRYWAQAERQLQDTGIVLKRSGYGENVWDAVGKEAQAGDKIAVDPRMIAYNTYKRLEAALQEKGAYLVTLKNPWQALWPERPSLPQAPLYFHKKQFVSLSSEEKLARIRAVMEEKNADYHLLSSLDDIAWITNLRGADVDYNPVFLAHLVISRKKAWLFIDKKKLSLKIANYLVENGFEVLPYEAMEEIGTILPGGRYLVDGRKIAYATLASLSTHSYLIEGINPSTLMKAQKTEQEIDHIQAAMVQDGIALVEFFTWLDEVIEQNKKITELTIAEELLKWRQKGRHYISLSFETIVGFNANSALPHYTATKDHYSQVIGNGCLLIDSGAQYQNGTTDITRVVAVRQVAQEIKEDFTRVLKAHIAMARLIYPAALPMPLLDAVARAPLWQEGYDYGHGTGHGVGYFLNVHEGPQVLSCYSDVAPWTRVENGMITSIEPGLYRAGKWGIRIENLAASVSADHLSNGKSGRFLRFKTLTICPIDKRLIVKNNLSKEEVVWLNNYHTWVKEQLHDKVSDKAKVWLEKAASPL